MAVPIAIQNLEELVVKTEETLHQYVDAWVTETKDAVKEAILEEGVFDTGATYEGVIGIYPIPRSRARILKGATDSVQKQEISIQTLKEYQAAKNAAKVLRLSLAREQSSQLDPNTGRPRKGSEPSTLDHRDAPFNAIGTVTRKNLYGGVQVITWYAWFPHEGVGHNEIFGPRRFFSEPVSAKNEEFVLKINTGLEKTIKGKLRLKR